MKIKNQTKKKSFTIVVYLNTEYGKEEVEARTVEAENPREAIRLAYKNIFQ